MKPDYYKSINASSTINVNEVDPPFKVIGGQITYIHPKHGFVLGTDIEAARAKMRIFNYPLPN